MVDLNIRLEGGKGLGRAVGVGVADGKAGYAAAELWAVRVIDLRGVSLDVWPG